MIPTAFAIVVCMGDMISQQTSERKAPDPVAASAEEICPLNTVKKATFYST
jgi:hypothetical protein